MDLISTSEQLRSFRENYLNPDIFNQTINIKPGGLFCNLPVGVGKSFLIDSILEDFQANPSNWEHDLIIVSAPTHQILKERRILQHLEVSSFLVFLSGRPHCGSSRNGEWKKYENSASISLGKKKICRNCPSRQDCFWPEQFQALTSHARIILLPQKYMHIFPGIMHRIIAKTESKIPLVLLDETNFSQDIFRRHIKRGVLENFLTILNKYRDKNKDAPDLLKTYRRNLYLLLNASEQDIASGGWVFFPIDGDVAAEIQEIGIEQYGDMFYYPGFDLTTFSQQNPGNRHLLAEGHIEFVCVPNLEEPGKLVVFSGTASKSLLEHRLDTNLKNLYPANEFRHQDTRFYNINIGSGMKHYYKSHLPQLLFFAFGYIKKTMKQNQSLALVTKKSFVEETIEKLNALLDQHFLQDVRVMPAKNWSGSHSETDPVYQVPVLHYGGAIGVNNFASINSVLCLCGYYMRRDELNRMVNEVLRVPYQTMFQIRTESNPLRRAAVPVETEHYSAYVQAIADAVLQQEEMGVVVQAIGRVRPFTQPREVITCQCGESPMMPYDQEFSDLKEARDFFNIPSQRSYDAAKNSICVHVGKKMGHTQKEISEIAGLSLRTVTREWNTVITDYLA